MSPTSPSPPSPVPFDPEPSRSPTWDEYLATNTPNSFEFPVTFGDPNTRSVHSPYSPGYTSTSTANGLSSYSARTVPPPRRLSPAINTKRTGSSPVSYPLMSFPMSNLRPGAVRADVKTMKSSSAIPDTPSGTQVGRWTKREHELFLEGLQRFGKSWKKISSLVHTRTLVQIRTHAQKYLQKQSRVAIKADAEAANTCKPVVRIKTQQTQDGVQLEMSTPRVAVVTPRQWKPRPGGRNSFAPLAFPTSLSMRTVSSSQPMTSTRAFQNTVSRLDQLLQDDSNAIPVFVDEYYTSPTAIEDDLLRPLYTNETQWVPRLAAVNYPNKRRRVEISGLTSTSVAVPVLRPAFPFEPLPAPDNLSSPSTSPSTYTQRQSAALLAAHETDETTNAWL